MTTARALLLVHSSKKCNRDRWQYRLVDDAFASLNKSSPSKLHNIICYNNVVYWYTANVAVVNEMPSHDSAWIECISQPGASPQIAHALDHAALTTWVNNILGTKRNWTNQA